MTYREKMDAHIEAMREQDARRRGWTITCW